MNQNQMDTLSRQLKQNRTWHPRMFSDLKRFQLLDISVMWTKKRGSMGRKKLSPSKEKVEVSGQLPLEVPFPVGSPIRASETHVYGAGQKPEPCPPQPQQQ